MHVYIFWNKSIAAYNSEYTCIMGQNYINVHVHPCVHLYTGKLAGELCDHLCKGPLSYTSSFTWKKRKEKEIFNVYFYSNR